uniref:Uncharacterized protein n=1 Tax=Arundo donax TaxID=35708 RepID=A0A0A8YGE7_ARUDO
MPQKCSSKQRRNSLAVRRPAAKPQNCKQVRAPPSDRPPRQLPCTDPRRRRKVTLLRSAQTPTSPAVKRSRRA